MNIPGRVWCELLVWTLITSSGCILLSHNEALDAEAARAALRAAQDEVAQGHSTVSSEQIRVLTDRARSLHDRMEERSVFERSETALYSRLSELANRSGVRIDQLVPSNTPAAPPTPSPEPPGAPGSVVPADSRSTYTMTVVGGYASLSTFMRQLESDGGFAVIRSARISPMDGTSRGLVRAVLVSDHFAFDVGSAAMEGAP